MTQLDKQLEKCAKKAFDQQAESLDSQTLQYLQMARQKALATQDEKPNLSSRWFSAKWLTGAGAGLALASILTFMLVPQLTSSKLSPLDDLEMLSAEADMDLYTQLEFYEWLDTSLDEG